MSENTAALLSSLKFGVAVFILIGVIVWKLNAAFVLCNKLRKIYPDAKLGFTGISFSYKGFKAKVSWKDSSKYTSAHTWFTLKIPAELRDALKDARFKLTINAGGVVSSLKDVRRRCSLNSKAHPLMQGLLRDQKFLEAAGDIDGVNRGSDNVISLGRSSFEVNLPDKALTASSGMVVLAIQAARAFDRVIAAASAVNPALLSMPPIAGNFTVNPGEFLNKCSDEAVYDALDDSAPVNHNPAGQTGGWGNNDIYDASDHSPAADDGHALPEANGGRYSPPDESEEEYDDEVIYRQRQNHRQ